MTIENLPPENTLNDVKIKIVETYSNPSIGKVTQAVLKDGPQAFKIATLLEVKNPKTGAFHHYSLKIDQIEKRRTGWSSKPEKSVSLKGKDPDEIEKLYKFLYATYKDGLGDATGDLHLVSEADFAKIENIREAIPNIEDSDKLELAGVLISRLEKNSSNISDFVNAFKNSPDETIQHIAIASRLIDYSKSLSELKKLVEDPNTVEASFQKHLEKNPWMFGSEYSELISRRIWTRDECLDYMLRRTVDDYLEIVEIKTAFKNALFLHDSSHDSYHPSSKLSPVIGQVIKYIEELERDRDSILAKDGWDTLKIRARVIVGRDGNKEHQIALRNFNSHLHQIEIITYDQLIRIAERVLSIFKDEAVSEEIDNDIPF